MINRYFESIGKVIAGFQEMVAAHTIRKKTYNDTQGLISGEIEFTNNSELSFMELKNTEQIRKEEI